MFTRNKKAKLQSGEILTGDEAEEVDREKEDGTTEDRPKSDQQVVNKQANVLETSKADASLKKQSEDDISNRVENDPQLIKETPLEEGSLDIVIEPNNKAQVDQDQSKTDSDDYTVKETNNEGENLSEMGEAALVGDSDGYKEIIIVKQEPTEDLLLVDQVKNSDCDENDCIILSGNEKRLGILDYHVYSYNDEAVIRGPLNTKPGLRAKFSMIPSIPLWGTQFWINRSVSSQQKVNIISVKGGEVSINLCNSQGPVINFDLYIAYDQCSNVDIPLMSQSEVSIHWKPEKATHLKKFRLEKRITGCILKPGEIMEFKSPHKAGQINTVDFKTRRTIPCFLLLVRGATEVSEIMMKMSNEIKYSCGMSISDSLAGSQGGNFEKGSQNNNSQSQTSIDVTAWSDFSDIE